MIAVDKPYWSANSVQLPDQPSRSTIVDHVSIKELVFGEVWICTSDQDAQLGVMIEEQTLITVGDSIFVANAIGLSKTLGKQCWHGFFLHVYIADKCYFLKLTAILVHGLFEKANYVATYSEEASRDPGHICCRSSSCFKR